MMKIYKKYTFGVYFLYKRRCTKSILIFCKGTFPKIVLMLRPAWNIYFSIRFCEFCKVTFYDAILEASESKVSADPNSVFIL